MNTNIRLAFVLLAAIGCRGSGSPAPSTDLAHTSTATDLAVAATGDLAAGDLATGGAVDLATSSPADLAGATHPSFANDVLPILTNRGCLSHHMTTAWNGVEGLASNAAIVAYLTKTASSQCGADTFVHAGDATDSYLYQKVSGNFAAPCAASDSMPFGAGPLPQNESDVIKAWINAGAAND